MVENNNGIWARIKPIFHTYTFEIKRHIKAFIIFSIIGNAICILTNFVLSMSIPEQSINASEMSFLRSGLSFISLLILFAACLFFSALIVGEYSKETGLIVFPKINKYKLALGKYLGNLTLVVLIVAQFYFFLGLFSLYFYGGSLPVQFYVSFGMALLYVLCLSGFVSFFSSFMTSVNMTIVSTILLLFIGFDIITQIIGLLYPRIEPLWSFSYLGGLITQVVQEEFPQDISDRYIDMNIQGFLFRTWITPSIEMGVSLMLLYMAVFFSLAMTIFSRKQI